MLLEEKFNQLELDTDMMYMDEALSNNQIATKSSEKVTTQQFPEGCAKGESLPRGPR